MQGDLAKIRKFPDQIRSIIKKGWSSGLEIRQKTNNEQNSNTVSETRGLDKQELSNRNEPPTSEKRQNTPQKDRANTNTRTKNRFRKFKENYE